MMSDWAVWLATFADGTTVHQKSPGVSYEDLDRENLREFEMWMGNKRLIHLNIREGEGGKLFWRRRVQMTANGSQHYTYIVGKHGSFVAALLEDGSIVIDDSFDKGSAILSDIQKVKGEV